MSGAADDKAIDKDLNDMSLFLVGQSAWFNAEERHYQEGMEAMVSQADPARVDAVEAGYQACLKNCKEVHDAHSMFIRLRAEIKRLRKGRADAAALIEAGKLQRNVVITEGVHEMEFKNTWIAVPKEDFDKLRAAVRKAGGEGVSKWNHVICGACWKRREGDRQPCRMVGGDKDKCCFCGGTTTEGIYVREDPMGVACGGKHS